MIEISEFSDFNKIRRNTDENFKLVSDIDASETREWNNGRGFEPIEKFTGILDGQGHIIRNIYINRTGEYKTSLIKSTYRAEIKNLKLERFDVKGQQDSSCLVSEVEESKLENIILKESNVNCKRGGCGGIVSKLKVDGFIEGCEVKKCRIKGSGSVGGVVGFAGLHSKIRDCTTSDSTIEESKSIGNYFGGLVGSIRNGQNIKDSRVRNITLKTKKQKISGSLAGKIGRSKTGIGSTALKNSKILWVDSEEGVVQIRT